MKKFLAAPLLVALLAVPVGAQAQSDAERITDLEKKVMELQKKDKAKKPKGLELHSVSDKGKLEWASADGSYKFRLAGRIQFDGAFFSGDENRNGNALGIRRGRIGFKATVAKDWTAELDVDFAENAVDIKDAYIGYEGIKNSAIQAGNFKMPFGMDQLVSSRDIWFLERAYVDAWAPGRRLAVGYLYGVDKFSAAATVFTQEIGEDTTGIDQGWGWAARGTWAPVMTSETRAIHIGAAATGRQPEAAVGSGSTKPPQVHIVEFSSRPEVSKIARAKYLNTGDMGEVDWVQQYGLELAGVWDAFAWMAEYQTTDVSRRSGAANLSDHDFDGWYGQVAYVFNGKRKYAGDEGLVDKVTPGKGGAWELAARYSTMDLNDITPVDPIKGGEAKNITFGLNYYPTYNIRLMLNWTSVDNDEYAKPKKLYGAIPGDDFSVFQFRAQFAF